MDRRALSVAALLPCLTLGIADARAETREGGEVRVASSCGTSSAWSSGAWVALLRVELAHEGLDVRAAPARSPPNAVVEPGDCGDDATSVTLTYVAGPARVTKTVDLRPVPSVARPRVLAIALADLIRSGGAAGPPDEAPPRDVHVHVEVAPPQSAPRAVSAPPLGRWGAYAAAESRVFTQTRAGLFGVRGGATVRIAEWLAAAADVGIATGSDHDPLGEIQTTTATGGAALLATGRTPSAWFGIGPRVDLGAASFRARAADEATTRESGASSVVVVTAMSALGTFQIAGALRGLVALDVGTTAYGFSARAGERRVTDVLGPSFAARVGLAWQP